MPRYVMTMKWSQDNELTISDHAGVPRFQVRKSYGLDGNSLSLRDAEGRQRATIRPRTRPAGYDVTAAGGPRISVRHKGWFGRTYVIGAPGSEMTARTGDFSSESYHLMQPGGIRATAYPQFGRKILVDMADGEDAVSLLSVVLAIETIREDRLEVESDIPFVWLILAMIN